MGDFLKLAGAAVALGILGSICGKSSKEAEAKKQMKEEEEKLRKSQPYTFTDGITRDEFEVIVKRSKRGLRRLVKLEMKGMLVRGTVRSQSGISDWQFHIDFSDYGHLTGRYWIETDNVDSEIPQRLAERISMAIKTFPECVDDNFEDMVDELENNQSKREDIQTKYCPYCGEELVGVGSSFCGYCGRKIHP